MRRAEHDSFAKDGRAQEQKVVNRLRGQSPLGHTCYRFPLLQL